MPANVISGANTRPVQFADHRPICIGRHDSTRREFVLRKASSQSLTEQLAGRFSERIRTRLLAPGARLPSVRQCAEQHGVSPSTVVAAYDHLLAQGLVEARKNRGFFVRELVPQAAEPEQLQPAVPSAINAAHW